MLVMFCITYMYCLVCENTFHTHTHKGFLYGRENIIMTREDLINMELSSHKCVVLFPAV